MEKYSLHNPGEHTTGEGRCQLIRPDQRCIETRLKLSRPDASKCYAPVVQHPMITSQQSVLPMRTKPSNK